MMGTTLPYRRHTELQITSRSKFAVINIAGEPSRNDLPTLYEYSTAYIAR